MREVNLRGIDLNLLVVLDALLVQENVTRAAERVGMSQPAMSRALGRLRALLQDPILARGSTGLVATPRARALHPRLKALLADIRSLVADRPFDPAGLIGDVTLAATDHQTIMLLPQLMTQLSTIAPGLDVKVVPYLPATLDRMLAGEVDLAFGVSETILPPGMLQEGLYQDRFVTLAREGHPALVDWTLDRFITLDHVLVTIFGDGRGAVDNLLAERGLERRIALRLPHFFAAITIVARTDLVVTLPASLASRFAGAYNLRVLEVPIQRAPFTVVAIWPAVLDADPANRWLRTVVRDQARTVEGTIPLRRLPRN